MGAGGFTKPSLEICADYAPPAFSKARGRWHGRGSGPRREVVARCGGASFSKSKPCGMLPCFLLFVLYDADTILQVVMAAARVFYYAAPPSYLGKIVQPLLRLLNTSKEVERVVLVYLFVISRFAPVIITIKLTVIFAQFHILRTSLPPFTPASSYEPTIRGRSRKKRSNSYLTFSQPITTLPS